MFSDNFFITFFKCLRTYQLNIIKIIKKRLQKKLAKDIKVFLKKEKEKKPHYGREQSKNLPEDEKLELVE